jgi:hypothetical protein
MSEFTIMITNVELNSERINKIVKDFNKNNSKYEEVNSHYYKLISAPLVKYNSTDDVFTLSSPAELIQVSQSIYIERVQISGNLSDVQIRDVLQQMLDAFLSHEFVKKVNIKIISFQLPGDNTQYIRECEPNTFEIRLYSCGFKLGK